MGEGSSYLLISNCELNFKADARTSLAITRGPWPMVPACNQKGKKKYFNG